MTQRSDPAEVRSAGPLFDTPLKQMSTTTDPQTSREAAQKMLDSGALAASQREAYELVHEYPGSTCKELGHFACRIDEDDEHARQRIGRRLNELEKAGLVRRDGVRDGCSIWFPTEGRK